jgi:type IX secretion system PorP/SprF family membrane protein
MRKLLFTIVLLKGLMSTSQDLENFYVYSLDWTNINNAYVGMDRSFDWLVMTRSQFNAIPNSPKNIVGLMHAGISENQGLGLKLINDSRGVFQTTRVDAIYAQKFNFNAQNFIRFGLSFGALNSNVDLSKLSNGDLAGGTGDPVPASSLYNYTHFVSGFGMVAAFRQFEFGVSAPHMAISNVGFQPFLFTTASYRYKLPKAPITLTPALIYQNRPDRDNVTDGFLTIGWREYLQVMSGYTTDNRMKLGAGVTFKDIRISYMSESPTGANRIANSVNEIAVRLKINQSKKKEQVDVRKEIEKLLDETMSLLSGDYDKAYLRKRIIEIEQKLDLLLSKNSPESAKQVEKEIDELETQLQLIIDKYKLTNE